jgi:SpoVK/Ycf46/Vps4 family AAA+-type ATPase
MPFISISAPSVVSGMSGESEKTLRETFEEAAVSARLRQPVVRYSDNLLIYPSLAYRSLLALH